MLMKNPTFDAFVRDMSALVHKARGDERLILTHGRERLAELVAKDDWLPAEFAQANDGHFMQYVLHADHSLPLTILSAVWGPGQSATPHNHTVWGLIGQLRGAEMSRDFDPPQEGQALKLRSESVLRSGQTAVVSPSVGDVHEVRNVADGVSVSIHVYGADLPAIEHRRRRFDAATGVARPFNAY
ncbi:cysteine dioxygenase [Hydrogenophaga sp.]|uniref:cysteine dioxygenase family protein n=1 Tax=Hydrogenophaga sp. TaxID=1904254 RepID=UPI0027243328|nr:cysteine dioxygenase [Hydrogenophaga sp.]MDO9435714.1 cysteine dioxygenase [Hydrogenophaga sp.]